MALTKRLTYQGDLLVDDTLDEVGMSDGFYSWQFDGTTQQISVPHNAVLALSNSDCCIEFWALPTATDTLTRAVYAKRASAAIFSGIVISCNGGSGKWEIQVANAAGSAWAVNDTTTISADIGVWQHIAIVRNGVNIYAYKNGVRSSLSSSMSTNVIFDDSASATIGSFAVSPISSTTSYGAQRFRGLISNFRVTKGAALYTAATVPLSSAPSWSQGTVTSLLTCQSPTFKDNSSYAHAIYDVNTPVISYRNPYTPEKSVYFNGVSSYLRYADNTAFQFGTGAFTAEAWVYLSSSSFGSYTHKRIWSYQNTGTSTMFWFGVTSGMKFSAEMRTSGGTNDVQFTGTTTVQLNTWYHVAVVRTGTTTYLYVNGTQEATATSMSQNIATGNPTIGAYYNTSGAGTPGNFWSGYISNLRIIKGKAIYTGNFVVPVVPLVAFAGASLLTCAGPLVRKDYSTNNFALSNIIDNPQVADINPFESSTLTDESSVGTAQRLSNSVSFNNASNQYLTVADNTQLQMGSSDFTAEAWINLSALPANTGTAGAFVIFQKGYTAGSNLEWSFIVSQTSGSYNLSFLQSTTGTSATTYLSSSISISTNTWYHVAITKSSTTLTYYLNGVAYGTSTINATSFSSTGSLSIGADPVGTAPTFPGYISNARIVKDVVVYTGAFTTPTSPLTNTQSAGTNIAAITNPTTVSILTCQNYGNISDNSFNKFTINTFPTALTTTIRDTVSTSTYSPFGSYQNIVTTNNYYSALFNGTSQYLSTNANSLTSENFTHECWFNLKSNLTYLNGSSTYQAVLFSSVGNGAYWINIQGTAGTSSTTPTRITIDSIDASASYPSVIASGLTISLNTWHHVAISRVGSTFAIWLDGVKLSLTTSGTMSAAYVAGALTIGASTTASYLGYFPGFISNARIVKGFAVYDPSGSNITVPTSPLTSIAGTYLLVCQSPTVTQESSATPFTLTNNGTVTADRLNPFRLANDYSVFFSGSAGSNINIVNNTAHNFGTGDFTVEFWLYPTSFPNAAGVIGKKANDGTSGWQIVYNSSYATNKMTIRLGGTTDFNSVSSWALNRWDHWAITRSGTTVRWYKNGVLDNTGSNSTNLTDSAALNIGYSDTWVTYITGYMSNVRIVKGTALYTTSSFTPSTTPLTAVSGTTLLACTHSQVRDYSENAFATTGSAAVSSTVLPPFTVPSYNQPEFPASRETSSGVLITNNYLDDYSNVLSKYSVSFNGSSRYLSIASNAALALGTYSWTIEFWIYLPSTPGTTNSIYDNRPASTQGVYPNLYVSSDRTIRFYVSSADRITSSALTLNTWYHVALVKNSTSTIMYLNGTQTGSTYTDTNNYLQNGTLIGASYGGGAAITNYFFGYLSNLRVVRGYALYTSSFSTDGLFPLTPYSGTALLTCQNPTIIDNSTNNLTITNNGTTPTTTIPLSFYSNFFSSTLKQYITVPNNSALQVTNKRFIVEAWINLTALPANTGTTDAYIIMQKGTVATSDMEWAFAILQTGGTIRLNFQGSSNGTTITSYQSSAVTMVVNTWYHVAITKSNRTVSYYLNGVKFGTSTIAAGMITMFSSTGDVGIGNTYTGTQALYAGYISNLRFINGSIVYSSDGFVPSTTQLTAIGDTKLLTCQSATLVDNSTNNFTLSYGGGNGGTIIAPTTISKPVVRRQYATGVNEFAGQIDDVTKLNNSNYGSLAFCNDVGYNSATFNRIKSYLGIIPNNYVNDYSVPDTVRYYSDFAFLHNGTTDYTVEFWVKFNATPGLATSGYLFDNTNGNTSYNGIQIKVNSSSEMRITVVCNSVTGDATTASNVVTVNTWYHVALNYTVSTNLFSLYINGTLVSFATDTTNAVSRTGTYHGVPVIGALGSYTTIHGGSSASLNDTNFFHGYISNFRITKQIVYTGAFTAPTSPLATTQSSGTNIAAITDSSKVVLLTAQSADYADNSIYKWLIKNYGTTFIKNVRPF